MARDRPPIIRVIPSPISAVDIYERGTECHSVPLGFISILIGVLDTLQSPEAWQGDDEAVALVLAQVNHFIGVFGTDETLCIDETTDNGDAEPPTTGAGFEVLETEGCEMSGCSIPYGALRWNGNILEYKYCGDWYPVGGAGASEPPVVEDDETLWPEEQEYSACGKATALVNKFWEVAATLRDNKDDFPWDWVHQARDAHPGIQLTASWIYNAAIKAIEMDTLGIDDEDIFRAADKSQQICTLTAQMADDYATPENLKNDMHIIIQNTYNWNFVLIAFWGAVLEAIGNNDLRNLALAGATDTDAICDCGQPPPAASKIFFTGETVLTGTATGTAMEIAEVRDGGRRMYFSLAGSDGVFRSMTEFDAFLAGAELGDTVTLRMYLDPENELYMPTYEWKTYTDPAPVEDWFELTVQGGNPVTRAEFSNYLEYQSDDDPAVLPEFVRLEDMRFYPQGGMGEDWRTYWYIEVVAVNGVRLAPIGP